MGVDPLQTGFQVERVQARGGVLLRLRGVIDERMNGEELVAGLDGAVVFDLDGVLRITSFGVREWLLALRALRADYYCFVKCRPMLVSQMNTVRRFAGSGEVISFYAPYECPRCCGAEERLLDLRQDYDIVVSLAPPPVMCRACNVPAEFDEVPEIYFDFARSARRPAPPATANEIIDGVRGPKRASLQIEKEIDEHVTALWISGDLETDGYFKRLADGLQGAAVVIADHVKNVTDAGAAALARFLCTPDAEIYVARLPPKLVVPLAKALRGTKGARVVSLCLPFSCTLCQRQTTLDLTEAHVRALQPSGTMALHCEHCSRPMAPAVTPAVLAAAATLPFCAAPPAVAEYLPAHREHPAVRADRESEVDGGNKELILGKYELGGVLGSGGMGDCYLAHHVGPGGFRRAVVLKKIRAGRVHEPGVVEQFLQEARLAARLSHPNIVQIFDLGKTGQEYFIAMEYVSGMDLRRLCLSAKAAGAVLPLHLGCRIVSDVLAALHAAHTHVDDAGRHSPIIHRDVSPDNVLISVDGNVKLTDFGIAKLDDSMETTPGVRKGKIRYIAPEQVGSDAQALDPRRDIYAAGVILYECLALRPLFDHDNELAAIRAIVYEERPRLLSARADLPARIEEIFQKGVARDPKERYGTAQAFQRDLEQVIVDCGTPATSADLAAWIQGMLRMAASTGALPAGAESWWNSPTMVSG
jgi:tRNA A-37 threonylcarbamoyl transferase component Bud32